MGSGKEKSPERKESVSERVATLIKMEGMVSDPPSVLPLVPEGCLFCGTPWKGGCQVPGKAFPAVGLRVFYGCGSSLSVWCDHGDGAVHLLAKNCLIKNP